MSPKRRSQPDTPPTFFLDRGLGRRYAVEALDNLGLTAVPMGDIYPDDGNSLDDDIWIREISERGWVALTKDVAILRAHTDALAVSTLRVFALPNANMTGPAMAERIATNIDRILQRARKPGPFVHVIHEKRLERRWPK